MKVIIINKDTLPAILCTDAFILTRHLSVANHHVISKAFNHAVRAARNYCLVGQDAVQTCLASAQ